MNASIGDPIQPYMEVMHYRFYKFVEFGSFLECWIWRGATCTAQHSTHYKWGVFSLKGRAVKASRLSWEINRSPIPIGAQVLHTCDNPLCVNPGHLYLGSPADNVADMDRKGRRVTVSRSGSAHANSKLSAEQVSEIRAHAGAATLISGKFGVTPEQINNIRRGSQRRNG